MGSNFKEYKLEEIMSFSQGKQVSSEKQFSHPKHGYKRFIRIVDYTKENEPLRYIQDPGERYYVNKNDLVMIRYGSQTAGKVVRGYDGVIANNIIKISFNKNELDESFVYYLLSNNKVYRDLNISQSSSTMPAITFGMLNNYKVKIPIFTKQKKIGGLLSLIDQKITLNNQVISNLEQLAQTLYKSWFVDFEFPYENGKPYKSSGGEMVESELGMIPEGWNPGKLSEIATLIMGQSPKSETYNEDGIGMPLINGASDFKKDQINPLKHTTDPKRVSQKGDFLFGVRATVGNVTYVDKEYALGRGVGVARANIDEYHEVLYFQLINGIDYLKSTATGSVYINFTKNDIEGMRLVIPYSDMVKKFHVHTRAFFEQKNLLIKQNDALAILRDTLLPKLLSGEIELPDETEVTEHVPIS